jgi:hypothetical protein
MTTRIYVITIGFSLPFETFLKHDASLYAKYILHRVASKAALESCLLFFVAFMVHVEHCNESNEGLQNENVP